MGLVADPAETLGAHEEACGTTQLTVANDISGPGARAEPAKLPLVRRDDSSDKASGDAWDALVQ